MEDKFGYLMKAELADYCREEVVKDFKLKSKHYIYHEAARLACGGKHSKDKSVYKIRS